MFNFLLTSFCLLFSYSLEKKINYKLCLKKFFKQIKILFKQNFLKQKVLFKQKILSAKYMQTNILSYKKVMSYSSISTVRSTLGWSLYKNTNFNIKIKTSIIKTISENMKKNNFWLKSYLLVQIKNKTKKNRNFLYHSSITKLFVYKTQAKVKRSYKNQFSISQNLNLKIT